VRPMHGMDEEVHFKYFWMSSSRFDDVLRHIRPYIRYSGMHSCPIMPQDRLAVNLRVLASGNNQRSVAQSYMMLPTTVSLIVTEVCKAIWAWTKISKEFWRVWNFPNCLGCIDGKHVIIQAPSRAVISYGRESDGGIFQECSFGRKLLHGKLNLPPPANPPGTTVNVLHVFLGDAAFPLHQNLMQPFPGVVDAQRIYNYRHSCARRVVENSFGILAKTVKVGKACVALHNYVSSTDTASPQPPAYIPPRVVAGDNNLLDIGCLSKARATRAAITAQNDFKSFFLTPEGLVRWQENVLRKGMLNRTEDNTRLL
uniref:DDE Tnp4 domain-containing protein n=1 Tax=Amphiprion percula TaxID=161767 RepID=A0A3P8RNC6_AMPPE